MKRLETEKTFVKLVTASGMAEADLWKAVLETAGISAYLRHEAMGALLGVTTDTLGGVELWVLRDDAMRAMEILQDERIEPGPGEEEA